MRFLLLLLPILMFFSFREQNQTIKIKPVSIQNEEKYTTPFEFYPNPVEDILTLRSSSFKKEMTKLLIFDISGKLIFEKDSLYFNNDEISEIDLSNLSSGLYFIQLRVKNYSATKKIVKI